MTLLKKNIKLYAKLLQSVGRQGRGTAKQPLSPLECAQYIKQLMEEENLDKKKVSERLGLGRQENLADLYKETDSTQVSLFLKLLDVSPKSQQLAGWGWEGPPKINFTTIFRMASLSHEDQDIVLQSVYKSNKQELISDDARRITKFKRENPDSTIHESIKKILGLKPVTIINYLVVCETCEKLNNFIKNNKDYEEKLLKILKDSIEGEFYELSANDIVISIEMDKKAYQTFHEQQEVKGIPFTEFLNEFLEDKLD